MALKGIKVIELAGLAPVPFCGMILSDFGATVLRIDKIGGNSDLDCLKNGKAQISINLKSPDGVSFIKRLCRTSDVLIEPFRSGVMEKLGLGPEILMKENPRLIYARLTGYGQNGSLSNAAGHDINYLALSGLLSLFGRQGDKPIFPVNLAADFGGGGLMCALGIVLALFERSRSNMGQIVDNSMVHGTAYLGSWLYRSQHLPIWGKERGQNILDTGAHFYEIYETKDGKFLSVGALEPQFYKDLLKGLEFEEENYPQYSNFERSKEEFKKRFLEKTRDEWIKIFKKLDACIAPVLDLSEAVACKHNKECDTFLNDQLIPNPAPKLDRSPGISSVVRAYDLDTRSILKDFHFSQEEISALENSGTLTVDNEETDEVKSKL